MKAEDSELWKRQYERQKRARQEAELLLENKSLELFQANQSLQDLNNNLEQQLRAIEEKDEAKIAAEEAAHAKSLFLANMSHEIRTPLNGIISMNRLLLETELDNEQIKFADAVQTSATSLLRILNDILDISKIEAGELDVEEETFSLLETLESVFDINQPKAERKGLQFIVNYDPIIPLTVSGDSTRLRQVLLNLISNAIKFTSKGMVHVMISSSLLNTNKHLFEFEISDSGIGMDEDTIQKVFEPFKQGDSSINRRFGGTGLGLSICKSLLEKMGGSIECSSVVNKGTVFKLKIPLGAVEPPSNISKFGNQCGTTILTAPTPVRQSALLNILKLQGFTPYMVNKSSEVFSTFQGIKSCAQCLWFIDIRDFNEKNHHELIDQLKSRPKNVIPMIIDNLFDNTSPQKLRYYEYTRIAFPNTLRELSDKLCKICNVACDYSIKKHPQPKIEIEEPSSVRILLAEDNEINQLAAKTTLEKFGFKVSVAQDGREAVSLLETNDFSLILMDINMPNMDGIEACKVIRSNGIKIPIIALTANAMKGDREKFLEYGMDDYLSKPLEVQMMTNAINRLVKNRKPFSDKTSTTVTSNTSQKTIVDLDKLRSKLGNDNDLIKTLLGKFDEEIHKNSKLAFQKLNNNELKQAISCFHLISGSAATLEMSEIKTVTSIIEQSLKTEANASSLSSQISRFKKCISNWDKWYNKYKEQQS